MRTKARFIALQGKQIFDKRSHSGEPLIHAINVEGAVGVGALAVGNVKYQLQNEMLKLMLQTDKPLYLDFREAFNKARDIV